MPKTSTLMGELAGDFGRVGVASAFLSLDESGVFLAGDFAGAGEPCPDVGVVFVIKPSARRGDCSMRAMAARVFECSSTNYIYTYAFSDAADNA